MDRSNSIQIIGIVAAILVITATMGTMLDASYCDDPCGTGYFVYGFIERENSDPPDANGLTIFYECAQNCDAQYNISCKVTSSDGSSTAYFGDDTDCPAFDKGSAGTWRVFAHGTDRDCYVHTDTVTFEWNGEEQKQFPTLTISHGFPCF
jgi:hypothetical protein